MFCQAEKADNFIKKCVNTLLIIHLAYFYFVLFSVGGVKLVLNMIDLLSDLKNRQFFRYNGFFIFIIYNFY